MLETWYVLFSLEPLSNALKTTQNTLVSWQGVLYEQAFSFRKFKKLFVFLLFFGMVQIGKFPPSLQTHNCLQTVIFIYLYQTVYIKSK